MMVYDSSRLKALLPQAVTQLRVFDEIDSTSSEARRCAASGCTDTALFIADRQSGGRGRMGRSFYSPSESGVYLSLLLPVKENGKNLLLMTSAAAVAVRRAILEVTGMDTSIKWVNDLYLGQRKVCGILCELMPEHRSMIIGVGINLYPSALPEEISEIAGYLLAERTAAVTREALAAAVVRELLSVRGELSEGAFMKEYREHSAVLGKKISYTENGVRRVGTATHVDDLGRLYVKDALGATRILSSGEISVRFK